MVRSDVSLALLLSFIVAPLLFGQTPSQTLPLLPGPAAPDAKLVAHLQGWERAMKAVDKFAVEATLVRKDLITQRESKFTGNIWCMKGGFARLNIAKAVAKDEKPNPADFMAYISNGNMLYEYDGGAKMVTMINLGTGGAGNNLLLDLMTGMSADAAMKRFDLKLLKVENPYVYIEAKPKTTEDKSEFETMTLVLCDADVKGRAYIPRMVILRKSNGQQTESWDFPDPKVNPEGIEKKHFEPQKPPEGWRVQKAEAPKAAPVLPPGGKLPVPGAK